MSGYYHDLKMKYPFSDYYTAFLKKYLSENKYKVSTKTYKKHFPKYTDYSRLRVSGFKIEREANGNSYISTPQIGKY